MKKILCICTMLLLTGCLSSGPEKTLENLATALSKKDSALFLAQFDMPRFSAANLQNITRQNPALHTLDSMSKMFGLGGMDDMLGSIIDNPASLSAELKRGVSTGELALACGEAVSPDCPWVAASLRTAKVKELSPTAAIAQVTTPTTIASWLALSKVGEVWLVVGQAPLEEQAAQYAMGNMPKPQAPPAVPAAPKKSAPPASNTPEKPTAL